MYFLYDDKRRKVTGWLPEAGVSCFLEYLQQAVGEWETWPPRPFGLPADYLCSC